MAERPRGYGITLVFVAAMLWSTTGLFVRAIALDFWTVLVWRSLFAALSLAILVAAQHRRQAWHAVRAIGWPGLLAIPVAATSMASYVGSLKLTTVANVMIVYATVPFVATGLSLVWIGERAGPRVLAASGIAVAGIAVMAGATTRPQDIAGDLVALLMTVTFAVQLVMARRFRTLDMAPVNAIAAAVCAALCWPLMAPGMPTPAQLLVLALFGMLTTALAYLLFLVGGRHIPSAEAGLIGMLDVVLAPLWVWLAFGEQPGTAALIGGGLVLASVLWYLAGEWRGKPVPLP